MFSSKLFDYWNKHWDTRRSTASQLTKNHPLEIMGNHHSENGDARGMFFRFSWHKQRKVAIHKEQWDLSEFSRIMFPTFILALDGKMDFHGKNKGK